MIGKN